MKTRNSIVVPALLFMLFIASCEYEFIEPDIPEPPGDTISFKTDVVPIFTGGDNCTGCHNQGGTPPDLSAENAYTSIVSGGFVNIALPEESTIYTIPAPTTSGHDWKKYSSTEAALLLEWIRQGALNN